MKLILTLLRSRNILLSDSQLHFPNSKYLEPSSSSPHPVHLIISNPIFFFLYFCAYESGHNIISIHCLNKPTPTTFRNKSILKRFTNKALFQIRFHVHQVFPIQCLLPKGRWRCLPSQSIGYSLRSLVVDTNLSRTDDDERIPRLMKNTATTDGAFAKRETSFSASFYPLLVFIHRNRSFGHSIPRPTNLIRRSLTQSSPLGWREWRKVSLSSGNGDLDFLRRSSATVANGNSFCCASVPVFLKMRLIVSFIRSWCYFWYFISRRNSLHLFLLPAPPSYESHAATRNSVCAHPPLWQYKQSGPL